VSRTIIVSDLHIDTWTERKIGATGKSKKEHFFDMLDWCEQAAVRELVINGDLMDLPPYVGQFAFPAGPCTARDVVDRLVRFASKVQLTCVFGNHDIGVSGFRSMGENSIPSLRNVNLCYPNYVIDDYPGSTILIEHGHFCDPFLLLYVRDLTDRTYRESKFEAFQWAMQRRKPAAPSERAAPGVLPPVKVEEGQNAYYTARHAQKPVRKPSLWSRIRSLLWNWGKAAVAKPEMQWWWQAALDEIQAYTTKLKTSGAAPKPVIYQIYGHTHRADPRDDVPIDDGISGIYINAGTWTEEVDEGWYLDVDANGKVWLQDWINEPAELRRLS